MRKIYSLLLLIILLISSCTADKSYRMDKGKVGDISSATLVSELQDLFKDDSIAVIKPESQGDGQGKYLREKDRYEIYTRTGEHLLSITPVENDRPDATIEHVEIYSPRYRLPDGLTVESAYGDFAKHYRLQATPTLQTALVEIPDINASFNVLLPRDKADVLKEKDLTAQIPDTAHIRHFTLWFR